MLDDVPGLGSKSNSPSQYPAGRCRTMNHQILSNRCKKMSVISKENLYFEQKCERFSCFLPLLQGGHRKLLICLVSFYGLSVTVGLVIERE